MRRVTAVIAGLLLVVGFGASGALAQEDEDSPATTESTTTTAVRGTSTVPTSTTTTEASTTTETVEGVSSTPTTDGTPTTAAAQARQAVAGDVVTRPLPRTGNEIGGTALFGGALTVLGVALALGARKRRNSFDGA